MMKSWPSLRSWDISLLKLVLILWLVLVSVPVYAQEGSQHITYEGQTGFFFPDAIGTKVLADLSLFHLQGKKLSLLEAKVNLLTGRVGLLTQKADAYAKLSDKYKQSYVLEHKLRNVDRDYYMKKLKAEHGFFKSSGFMFGLGFFVASLCAVGLTFGLREARQ